MLKPEKNHVAPPETCGKCGKIIRGTEAAFMFEGQITCRECATVAGPSVQKDLQKSEVKPPDYTWMKIYAYILKVVGLLCFASAVWSPIMVIWDKFNFWSLLFYGAGAAFSLLCGLGAMANCDALRARRDAAINSFMLNHH